MQITVLGPLGAEIDGQSIVPAAAKPRQLLALLALHRNRAVPVAVLMEEIWGPDLPRSAVTTLQTYVLQLRRRIDGAMGPGAAGTAKDVLATSHGGYRLRVPEGGLDASVYEELAAQGRAAYEAGKIDRASTLLGRALAMWSGPALVDVRVGTVLEVERVRLAESRLGVLELRIEANLRLGQHRAVLAELPLPLAQHPLHEGLHALAMLAYYRSGRQADALRVYHDLRTRLTHELGLEPCARLQRMQHAVLTADPALDVRPDGRRVAGGLLTAA